MAPPPPRRTALVVLHIDKDGAADDEDDDIGMIEADETRRTYLDRLAWKTLLLDPSALAGSTVALLLRPTTSHSRHRRTHDDDDAAAVLVVGELVDEPNHITPSITVARSLAHELLSLTLQQPPISSSISRPMTRASIDTSTRREGSELEMIGSEVWAEVIEQPRVAHIDRLAVRASSLWIHRHAIEQRVLEELLVESTRTITVAAVGAEVVARGMALMVEECLPLRQGIVHKDTVLVLLPWRDLDDLADATHSPPQPRDEQRVSSDMAASMCGPSMRSPFPLTTMTMTASSSMSMSARSMSGINVGLTPTPSKMIARAKMLRGPVDDAIDESREEGTRSETDRHRQVVVSAQALRSLRCFSGSWVRDSSPPHRWRALPFWILTDLALDCVGMEWNVRFELEQEIHGDHRSLFWLKCSLPTTRATTTTRLHG